ncbi:MAG: xylulose-5-phosphate/fructose-6-phosphate phosphoketolase [Acidimicrobiaceae bacterium]|nr:xylulose-5-phosphate/fructose-6-phosphate phosphoketolase [Acidimicrobiaceae bacterium]
MDQSTAAPISTPASARLSDAELSQLDRWWRAANYLSVGQIYLMANPLLEEPLLPEHVKPRLLGHWGTTPGLNFLWAHLCRVIDRHDLRVLFVCGPGHGGPAMVASTWLEGSYSEVYPTVPRDAAGMGRLFRQFSFPGGIPSHASPDTPGSIHEGGELGYSLAHAYGAAFDNPELVVACVIGDGEAETGALATAWHSNKFLDPVHDGAVIPILHLNGYKIANPSVLSRIGRDELCRLLEGYGYRPYIVEGHDPAVVHGELATALDEIVAEIRAIQLHARSDPGAPDRVRPRWPALIFATPKGWTGPAEVDGVAMEGTWRAHQIPLTEVRTNPAHLAELERWLRRYRPEELFDSEGRPMDDIVALAPPGDRRMGLVPQANGGVILRDLDLPDIARHAVVVADRGAPLAEATRVLGGWLRDVMAASDATRNFRLFGPDETASNRLGAVLEVTAKAWQAEVLPTDVDLGRSGRVMEILSEHTCQGWLEGYLLSGRHGLFNCYEAFIHIVDSMFNQHAKWLEASAALRWRRPVASLNYLLSSHVWRQDHNGFSHQDPGFIDHVINKAPSVVRVYLPPDANCLLSVADHCLRSRNYVNVIVAGKQSAPTWLSLDEAMLHCARGVGMWEWASSSPDDEPDVVLACCGDVPTLETLAAVDLLRSRLPELNVRVVNVVDLLRLAPDTEHPHGLSDREFDTIFTADKPVIFAHHGYPTLIHRLAYRRTNHANIHVRGYKEQGTTTTPFDMVMLNDLDRFHLVMDVIDRVSSLGSQAATIRQEMVDMRATARAWTRSHGEDLPQVRDWAWPG